MAAQEQIMDGERLLSHLLERYTVDFAEILTLESQHDFIYLSDVDSYELYLVSAAEPGVIKKNWKDYKGGKCYQVLQDREEPCPFCTNSCLDKDQYYIWRHYNDVVGRDYVLKDKLVEWEGKLARLEVVMDVSDSARKDEVLSRSLDSQNLVFGCIRPLLEAQNIEKAFGTLLGKLGTFYGADDGFVWYFGGEGEVVTWTSCGQGGSRRTAQCKISGEVANWEKLLRSGRQVIIKDVEEIREDAALYRTLKKEGTFSFCITPIYLRNSLAGFIGLHNITKFWSELSNLQAVSGYASTLLEREKLQQDNRRIMYYDQLTGYLNFDGFRKKAEKLLASGGGKKHALWYSDLLNFKYFNDVFGYEAGDSLLRRLADTIAETLGEDETFCRVSSDHFALLQSYEEEKELWERFRYILDQIGRLRAGSLWQSGLSLSCGIYLVASPDKLSLNEMLNRANMAQNNAKNTAGSNLTIFDEPMRKEVLDRIDMEEDMKGALRNREFVLYLQPQVPLQEEADHYRAEVLVRWARKDGTITMPGDFIELFEKDGLIVGLDHYVFEHACRYLRSWEKTGQKPLRLSVNVSRITMLQPDFVEYYCRIRDQYQVPRGMLELEFTERVIVANHEKFREIVAKLKENGFWCAMDDFGADQSSLNVLRSIPLDVLKLDRLFFKVGTDQERGKAVVQFTLRLARDLHMECVAEGVEAPETVKQLKDMSCDYVQGYVFSKPVPSWEYPKLIRSLEADWKEVAGKGPGEECGDGSEKL